MDAADRDWPQSTVNTGVQRAYGKTTAPPLGPLTGNTSWQDRPQEKAQATVQATVQTKVQTKAEEKAQVQEQSQEKAHQSAPSPVTGQPGSETSSQYHQSPSPRVLLAEDSEAVLGGLQTLLGRQGCQVSVAADGISVLSDIPELCPDILFIAARLPGLDGFQTCALIRNSEHYADLFMVLLLEQDCLLDQVKAELAGASCCIVKPFANDEILKVIARYQACRNSRQAAEGLESATGRPQNRAHDHRQEEAWAADSAKSPGAAPDSIMRGKNPEQKGPRRIEFGQEDPGWRQFSG